MELLHSQTELCAVSVTIIFIIKFVVIFFSYKHKKKGNVSLVDYTLGCMLLLGKSYVLSLKTVGNTIVGRVAE